MIATLLLLAACGGKDAATGTTGPGETTSSTLPLQTSSKADLHLVRGRQLARLLEQALEIPRDEVCLELGSVDCFDIHRVTLGATLWTISLYDPVETIGLTTPTTLDRILLKSCWTRLQADRAGNPVVFGHVDLEGTDLPDDALQAQVAELANRFWKRDPLPEEVAALGELHDTVLAEGGDNAEWAWLACYAVASTTETLFY